MAKGADLIAKIGSWAFIIGVIIALVIGAVSAESTPVATSVLVLLGLIVGFLNVTGRETTPFLLAAVSLVIVSASGGQIFPDNVGIFKVLQSILKSIITFVMPATIIVALKAIYALAHDE
ncbi:MAG: hypothetical protein ACP5OA_04945 [Candidatus Woesearchaeota archaeon]